MLRLFSLSTADMAYIRKTRTGRFELTLSNKLLPKGKVYFTFDSQEEAATYGDQAEKWLAAGMVPPELVAETRGRDRAELLGPVIRAWVNSGQPSAADQEALGRLFVEVGGVSFSDFNYAWCEDWVRRLKLERNLAPGSIRKRVQALSKAVDWHLRRSEQPMVGNPLHLLPKGYSTYNARDAEQAQALDKKVKTDVVRDRRLPPDEEAAVRAALAGVKRADRQRALDPDPEFTLLFEVILGTGMRLREAYRLRVDQVDLQGRQIRPQSSKAWHGRVKFRGIPLAPHVHQALAAHLASRGQDGPELVFPALWDGDASAPAMKRTTARLSARFAVLFDYARLPDFTEHDLRHETTCRWYEMRSPDGGWLYRPEEINRIMGWAPNSLMALRYASFRAEDLAARMYQLPRAERAA